jgi:hypothetical protein
MLGQKVYAGQTGRSIETRCKEHTRYVCLYKPDKSAVAEHSTELGHRIKFKNTEVLAKTARHIVNEATEVRIHPNNINRGEGCKLSKERNPAINILKHTEERDLISESKFSFRARHSKTLHCMWLTDRVTLSFNNNMYTAAVSLDIERAFDTTWHPGLLYKLSVTFF